MSERTQDRVVLLAFAVAAVVTRAPALMRPLMPDEAGFLLVARQWDPAPGHLYGGLWVDRPPQLIATFGLADALAGPYGPRILVCVLSVASVLCAHRIGTIVGGRRAARWSALFVLLLISWPYLTTWAAKSESLGVPLVIISCWLAIESLHTSSRRAGLTTAFLAGVAGGLAIGMKQSLIGGAVFGLVLLAGCWVSGRLDHRTVLSRGAAALVGFVLPMAATVGWVLGAGLSPWLLWDALVGFRLDALKAITGVDSPANTVRAIELAVLAVSTGLAVVIAWFVVVLPRVVRERKELAAATTVMLVVDVAGLVLGGSYWTAYLQVLIPSAALVMAMLAALPGWRGAVPRLVTVVAIIPLLATFRLDAAIRGPERTASGVVVGHALREAAHTDDSVVVIYGAPQIVWASGLDARYRHLWSLPIRTLDPELDELHAILSGGNPPTWLVQRGPVNTWRLDPSGRVRSTVIERYERVARTCDISIWRLRSEMRPEVPPVDCSRVVGPLETATSE